MGAATVRQRAPLGVQQQGETDQPGRHQSQLLGAAQAAHAILDVARRKEKLRASQFRPGEVRQPGSRHIEDQRAVNRQHDAPAAEFQQHGRSKQKRAPQRGARGKRVGLTGGHRNRHHRPDAKRQPPQSGRAREKRDRSGQLSQAVEAAGAKRRQSQQVFEINGELLAFQMRPQMGVAEKRRAGQQQSAHGRRERQRADAGGRRRT